MSDKDKKIRLQWLILLMYSMVVACISPLLQLWHQSKEGVVSESPYFMVSVYILSCLAFGWIAYYCIYKKPGTKLLTFSICVSILSLVLTPILYLNGTVTIPDYIPFPRAYLLLTQGMGIWWVVACLKMRKINKNLQQREATQPVESLEH